MPTAAGIQLLRPVASCHPVIGRVWVGVIPPLGVASGSRLLSSSSAVCHRSAARLARQRMMTASSAGGQLGRCRETGSGVCVTCAARICCEVMPVNGGRPLSSSYAMAPDGVDVDPVVEVRVGGGLLRCHVARRAERDAGGGELLAAGGLAHRLGHAEVGHQRVPAGNHHVVGLDVAVDHFLAVGVGQRVHHFDEDLHGVMHRQLTDAGQPVAERLAVDVRHDEVEEAAGFTGIVERENVRVLQAGGDLDLAEEALAAERGGQFGPQHLERHLAAVPDVLGQVHRGHAAGADFPLDAVLVGEGGGQAGEGVAHGERAPSRSPTFASSARTLSR